MSIKVNCLNPIAACGLDLLDDKYEIVEDVNEAEAVLVRSASMHDMELSDHLTAIARAGGRQQYSAGEMCGKRNRCVQYTGSQCQWSKGAGCGCNASRLP